MSKNLENLWDAYLLISEYVKLYKNKQIHLVKYSRTIREIEKFIINFKANNEKQRGSHWTPCWENKSYLLRYAKDAIKLPLTKTFRKQKRKSRIKCVIENSTDNIEIKMEKKTEKEIIKRRLDRW